MVPLSILETVVYCEDLDAARRFYGDALGLEFVSAEPGRHVFFRAGSSMLLVFNPKQTRSATVHVGASVIPRHGAEGASHFAFQVDDSSIESIRRTMNEQGVAIESEINWPGGGHSIYCRDPAGNSVEFATRSLWFRESNGHS